MESFFHGKSSGLDPLNSYLSLPILINSKDNIEAAGIPSQSTTGKEKVNTVQVGYNLGPVAVQASVAKYENLMGASGPVSGDDGKLAQIRLTTKF